MGISTGSTAGYLQQPSRPLLSSQGRSLTQNEFGGLGSHRSSSRFAPTSSAFRSLQVSVQLCILNVSNRIETK